MLLAIDPATRVGWAAGVPGAEPMFGVRDFGSVTTTDSPVRNGAIIATFRAWLNERCYKLRPELVCFESPYVPIPRQPRFGKQRAADPGAAPMDPAVLRRLLGQTGTIEAVCWELGIRCCETTSSAFTKYFTGRGTYKAGNGFKTAREAKKAAVVRTCLAYGWDVDGSDDAGDALALWSFAEAQIDPAAASRRRAAIGQELALHGSGNNPEIERPAMASRGPLRRQDERVLRDAAQPTDTLFGATIPVIGGSRARKTA